MLLFRYTQIAGKSNSHVFFVFSVYMRFKKSGEISKYHLVSSHLITYHLKLLVDVLGKTWPNCVSSNLVTSVGEHFSKRGMGPTLPW